MNSITVHSGSRNEMIDITTEVQEAVDKSGVKDGYVILYVPHTTAAITINEGADPSVKHDILSALNKLIPHDSSYRHAEGNSNAHIKSSIIGCNETVLIENGKLVLGIWQHIFFFEGDGPRTRKVYIGVFGK
jgi:secondary thiamine-phosphate synthase enzyme